MMMMSRTATRAAAARSMITTIVGPRYFSTTTTSAVAVDQAAAAAAKIIIPGGGDHIRGGAKAGFVRFPFTGGMRQASTVALDAEEKVKPSEESSPAPGGGSAGGGADEKGIVSYWGVQPKKVTKEDGTAWKWSCFMVCKFVRLNYLEFVSWILFVFD